MRPGIACKPSIAANLLKEIGVKFSENPVIKKNLMDPGEQLATIFYRMFDRPIEHYASVNLTKGDIKAFSAEADRVVKGIESGKMNGKMGRLLYSTEERVRNNPAFAQVYDDFININHNNKGRKIRHGNSYNRILEGLREEAVASEMYTLRSDRDFNKARKQANKLEEEIFYLQVDAKNEVPGAIQKLSAAVDKQDAFLRKGEGRIFYDFVQLIENKLPALEAKLRTEYLDKRKAALDEAGKKGRWLSEEEIRNKLNPEAHFMEITESPFMRKALSEYVTTMDDMYSVLRRGIDKYMESIEYGLEAKGIDASKIKDIKSRILERIMPDKKAGYYPHYNYDLNAAYLDNLMPHLDKLSVATRESFSENRKNIDDAIQSVTSYLSSRAKPRKLMKEGVDPKEYSKNFPIVLKRYIDEINRFNFTAHSQAATRKSLMLLKKMFREGKSTDGYGLDVVNEIMDLNAAQTGTRDIGHPEFQQAMRTMLNMEFTSKLGLNLRSAFRNASQSLLNYVFFGHKAIKESRKLFGNDRDLERQVDLMMEEAGIRFEELTPELQEIGAGQDSFRQNVRVVGGKGGGYELEFKRPSKLSKLAKASGWLASKTGVMMRKVENLNRKATFRISFANMYKKLLNDPNFARSVEAGEYRSKNVKSEAMTRARNYALRMTTMLHFDYSTISKSKLMQHPFGMAAFQFQHYAVKFFELNKNVMQRAWKDISAGDTLTERFGGENVWRGYRMGLAYFLAPAIATAITGVSVSNIVEHNTTDKLKQLWTLFTGDDEEIKKAFYGRGPLTALVTGPLVSDALALGEILELHDLDEDSWANLALGFNDYGDATDDQKFYSLLRIANTQIGRSAYSTFPMLTSGNLGMALQTELGLYPAKKAKELRGNIKDGIETISPELMQSIEELMSEAQQHKKRAIKPLR